MTEKSRYPLYHMIVEVDGKSEDHWLSLGSAGATYNSGMLRVEIGQFVIDAEGSLPRRMTKEEEQKIQQTADEISARQ